MLPSYFIAHGSPLLAIEDNDYTQFLNNIGQTLLRLKAVILFSAHWESFVQKVSKVKEYDTIYDFGGFPSSLHQIKYPAQGDEEATQEIVESFKELGLRNSL